MEGVDDKNGSKVAFVLRRPSTQEQEKGGTPWDTRRYVLSFFLLVFLH
jgi:hypothetical protein